MKACSANDFIKSFGTDTSSPCLDSITAAASNSPFLPWMVTMLLFGLAFIGIFIIPLIGPLEICRTLFLTSISVKLKKNSLWKNTPKGVFSTNLS
jgi:hypothetical protein